MIVWLAGAESKLYQDALAPYSLSLQSFLYLWNRIDMIDPSEFVFFLDSGAFSAWSRGSVIDIDEYCAFIKANIAQIEVYANLDVIAGEPGKHATTAQREDAAARSWQNFLYMRKEGLSPMPVFHSGESWKWLDQMLEYGCDYIGLGGMVGSHLTSALRRAWLDSVFARICDADGRPRVKVHGFGMTAIPLIFRYPWYSVDSTSWIQTTANGAVYLPAVVDGEFVFDRPPMICSVSLRSPKQSQGGRGSNTMAPSMRAILDKWLAICGKTYEEVQSHYYHRGVCNVTFFKRVSEAKAQKPFKPDSLRTASLLA